VTSVIKGGTNPVPPSASATPSAVPSTGATTGAAPSSPGPSVPK
jgi:hypothetical protein